MSIDTMRASLPRSQFRKRLRAGELLVGTFVKTPHHSVVEVLSCSSLDCVCLDAEHAPFDRGSLDAALLAAQAGALPALVRTARSDEAEILNALDLGATGILVPHVATEAAACKVASAARYGEGRGYAGSTRAAGYTTRQMREIIATANEAVAVIAQIEDASALDHIDEIASVEGIDALFIGRMDLTVSLGCRSPADAQVIDAVRAICAAARQRSRAIGMFMPNLEELERWRGEGASFFLLGSDQQWLLQGAHELAVAVRSNGTQST